MSSEDVPATEAQIDAVETPKSPTEMTQAANESKKRPRLDLSAASGRERKRGKSMFGLLVGTLNKAKIEDKERNASDAAKKRQLIEQRLQAKLRKETDSVRRAEDAKKDKTTANRKEEDIQLKDSIYKLRRTRLPLLANFLVTSDVIPSDDTLPLASINPLAPVPRSHPPPLYYLPAILTPDQEAFLTKRKVEVTEAVEKEWQSFVEERSAVIDELSQLRHRVAEEEARRKTDKAVDKDEMDTDIPIHNDEPPPSATADESTVTSPTKDTAMEVDDVPRITKEEPKGPVVTSELEKKDESAAMEADDDDAVEY